MKVSLNTNNNNKPVSFKGIYNNKILLKSLKFAADNGTLFGATATLGLSLLARPAAIMAAPKTDKENKKYACAKSYSSSIVNYLILLAASLPIARAVKKIDAKPAEYLKNATIKNLKGSAKTLQESKKYTFLAQMFKLGTGLVIAVPKSALTCALIPFIMTGMFSKKMQTNEQKTVKQNKVISFKGIYDKSAEHIAKGIGKLIDKKPIQNAAKKFCDTNFAQHIMSLTDVVLTLSFVHQTAKSKKIEQERKKPLMFNSLISTALCLSAGYGVNSATNKSTEKYIEKFRNVNKDLPELEKYVEGIKIAKPVLILGVIYYAFIPLISTFLADRVEHTETPQLLK